MVSVQAALRISLIALLHSSIRHREMGDWEESIARCNEAMSIAELIFGKDTAARAAVVQSCNMHLHQYFDFRLASLGDGE